mmetsp:Transcript_64983/g.141623  ORF Transcript_64983/g.141623 Transcript_64983/m.141623 type:complete len:202 (+) Transcript_64983:164-769(+)
MSSVSSVGAVAEASQQTVCLCRRLVVPRSTRRAASGCDRRAQPSCTRCPGCAPGSRPTKAPSSRLWGVSRRCPTGRTPRATRTHSSSWRPVSDPPCSRARSTASPSCASTARTTLSTTSSSSRTRTDSPSSPFSVSGASPSSATLGRWATMDPVSSPWSRRGRAPPTMSHSATATTVASLAPLSTRRSFLSKLSAVLPSVA